MRIIAVLACVGIPLMLPSCSPSQNSGGGGKESAVGGFERAQVPTWSRDDMEFFLHGSMGADFLPERVLAAFRATFPDMFPGQDLTVFGLLRDPSSDLPVGIVRRRVAQLGGQTALGLNCAACHTAEISPARGGAGASVRVIGTTGNFDPEILVGTVFASTWKTQDPANMERFLGHYLKACDPDADEQTQILLEYWFYTRHEIVFAAIQEDPSGAKGAGPGGLQAIASDDLMLDRKRVARGDLAPTVRALLKLFHNMRTLMHIPDVPPTSLPPLSGPGRNDPWGIISAGLFGVVTDYAPVKIGVVWNEGEKPWAHHDGNNRDTLSRNLVAAFALGSPIEGKRGILDLEALKRHTYKMDVIRPPRYPWTIDRAAADRGAKLYRASCASCHDGPQNDARLHSPEEIGTDPVRARIFDDRQARLHNEFPRTLEVAGYTPPATPAFRVTHKYWSPSLDGVWARVPYLHNGSVRTMEQLLTPPASREKKWHRGSAVYDTDAMGYVDDGPYVLDTAGAGSSNAGHDYGTQLSSAEKRDLIAFLKTK